MGIGLFYFIGQLLEFISDMWELPSSIVRSIAMFFYAASGIGVPVNNEDNDDDDEQE